MIEKIQPERISESKPSKEKEKQKKNLHAAFEYVPEAERIIDHDTAYKMKLWEFSQFLLYGNIMIGRGESREPTEKTNLIIIIFEQIQQAPTDVKAIKLRQELINDLIASDVKGDSKDRVKKLNELRDYVRGNCSNLSMDFIPVANETGQIKDNLNTFEYYLGGHALKLIESAEDKFNGLTGRSAFFIEMKESFSKVKPAIEQYVEKLRKSNVKPQLEALLAYQQTNDEKYRAKLSIKNSQEFRTVIDELNTKGKVIENFIGNLASFGLLLTLSEVVIERKLRKAEIVEGNIIEFKEARHPFLIERKGRKGVVPFDISITNEKPNIIVTGDNGTGKTVLVDTIQLNSLLLQTIGYGFIKSGRYSPRKQISQQRALAATEVDETQYSRGQREMMAFSKVIDGLKNENLFTMDEFLTSTDSVGSLSIILALLESNAKKGGIGLLTIHSRDLKKIRDKNLAPSVQFIRAKEAGDGKKSHQWEEGIGRANPIALAKEVGLPADILKRAKEIQNSIEKD